MSQQPVSNEVPLILPVPIIGIMFFLLCFNKVSGRTYLQVKRVFSLHHMNNNANERSEFARSRKIHTGTEAVGRGAHYTSKASNGDVAARHYLFFLLVRIFCIVIYI